MEYSLYQIEQWFPTWFFILIITWLLLFSAYVYKTHGLNKSFEILIADKKNVY